MTKAGWPFAGLIDEVYMPYFNRYGERAIPPLVGGSVSRMAFLSAYKRLPPLSEMPEKEKTEMKKYVNDLFKNETPQFRLEACKIIYCLGTLL